MTSANHPYRLSLVVAYADAYKEASRHGLPGADSPARSAARDFPRQHLPSPQAGASASPDAASQARQASALALSTAPGGARDDHNQRNRQHTARRQPDVQPVDP